MKILFLYPEIQGFSHKPLGPSLLSSILKKNGHTIFYFDSSLYNQDKVLKDWVQDKEIFPLYWFKKIKTNIPRPKTLSVDVIDAFNKYLDECQPELILVSTTYVSYQLGVNIISKSNAKKLNVIFGGIQCIIDPEEAISYKNVKYVHIGEGELSLPIIVDKLDKGESIDHCENLWVKKEDGEIIKNPIMKRLEDLDSLPFYDWDLFTDYHYLRPYEGNVYRIGDYAMSRGCVYNCTYCYNQRLADIYNYKRNIVRHYSPERAIEELVYLKERHHITFIKFHDSDFLNVSSAFLDKFSSLYQKHVSLPNTIAVFIRHVNETKLKFLRRMNTQSISNALESGSEHLRHELLNRTYTNKEFIEKSKLIKKYGFRLCTSCMIGLPDETREDIMETIHVLREAQIDHADIGIFFPFPKLPLTDYAISKGHYDKDTDPKQYLFGLESPLKLINISNEDLISMLRCSMLYFKLPKFLWPFILYAEKFNNTDGIIWKTLRQMFFLKLHYFDMLNIFRKINK